MAVAIWALTGSAHSLTFDDGFNEGWAEQHGPQFLLPWSAQDIETVRRALDKLEDEHLKDKAGIDDYLMGRRARILEKLDTHSFIVLGTDGTVFRWVTNPEIFLVGFAVSRDRYRVAPEKELVPPPELGLMARIVNWIIPNAVAQEKPRERYRLDYLADSVDRYGENTAAIALFERIEKAQHMMPGGAER